MSVRYFTNTGEVTDFYERILINAKEASVKIEPACDDSTKLVFFQKRKRPYSFDVQNGTLIIKLQKLKWYNFLSIGFNRSEIKIRIPKSILETLSIKATVGSIHISSIVCKGDIDIKMNTGKVSILDTNCKYFHLKGNTGKIELNKLTASDRISINQNTGNVSLTDCDCREFFVKTNTGNVYGKLPQGTLFLIKTNTGKVETPKMTIGETINAKCEIITHTGNITFE